MARKVNALRDALEAGFIIVKECGEDDERGSVKMLRTPGAEDRPSTAYLVLTNRQINGDCWMDMYGLLKIDEAEDRFNLGMMDHDVHMARRYSLRNECTVYVATNGHEIIWSDSPSQIRAEGFWILQIFEHGHVAEA